MKTERQTANEQNALSALIEQSRRYALLSVDDERALIRAWQEKKDEAAAQRVIGSHLRLVIKMARSYRGYGIDIADLVAEGNLGMMQALDRFDVSRDVRFATYAGWWIRAAMQNCTLKAHSLVRIGTTAVQKRLFFNLSRAQRDLGVSTDKDMTSETIEALADMLCVTPDDIVDAASRFTGRDASLNVPMNEDNSSEWQDLLPDTGPGQDEIVAELDQLRFRRTLLDDAMTSLRPRERHIIEARRLRDEPVTLAILADQYGISRERVRQIEVQAFNKLCKLLQPPANGNAPDPQCAA